VTKTIKEFDQVVLTCGLPEEGLKKGDVGVVVLVHRGGGYELEFVDLLGETITVASAAPRQVRRVKRGEIASARLVESARVAAA
jgi:hypothetical protein